MKKLVLVMLISAGFIASGCGKQQDQAGSAPQGTTPSQVSAGQVSAQATQTAAQTQQKIQQTATEMAKKAQVLLAQAKQYLDQGKLNEAISVAQNVLSFDPKNMDAQNIINMAKAKLKALAEQKAGELKSGLMNKLGSVGK